MILFTQIIDFLQVLYLPEDYISADIIKAQLVSLDWFITWLWYSGRRHYICELSIMAGQ